jgi:hypothetical protein
MNTPGAGEDLEAFATGRPGCFRAGDGRRYTVRACEGHRGGLEAARRLKP